MALSRREFIKYSASMAAFLLLDPGQATAAPDQGPQTWVKGVCRYCGTGCGVMVGVRDGKVVMVKGDPNNHNKGLLCLKGALLPSVINAPDRLTKPLIRKGGQFVPASWDEALNLTAARFKAVLDKDGPQAVAYYGSGQALTEESYLANKIFKAGLKSNNVDGNPRLCMASAVGGYVTTFGKDEPMGCYDDMDAAACFFIIGSNTSECHPVLFRRLAARKQADPNVKVIVVDPRLTNTARLADLFLPIIPGTDLALLNAMAHVIINEELDDPRFHGKYTVFRQMVDGKPEDRTFEEYRAFVAEYTPEKAAAITGVPAESIVKAAKLFASSTATMSLWCMGLNQRIQGVWANNLVHNLHLLTGKICKRGSTSFSLTGQPNACGGVRDTGSLAHLLPGGRLIAKKEHRNEMERIWGLPQDSLAPKPGLFTTAMFGALGDSIKALLVLCTNPAQTLPNVKKYTANLKKDTKFLAVIEAFGDAETLKYADVVFPAAFWCEREGVYGCGERRYALIEKAVDPPGEARPGVNILVDLALRMGVDPKLVPFKNSAEVWDEWREVSSHSAYNFKGMTRERLRKTSGLLWPCPTEDHPGTNIRYARGEDPNIPPDHPDKFFFYGNPGGKAIIWLRPHKGAAEPVDADYPFVLTTGRVIDQWHSGTMTGKVPEIHKAFPSAFVEINQDDAKRLGIANGDAVRVETRRGTMDLPARVGEVCRPGLIFLPFYDAKKLVNELTIDAIDDISKQPEFKICAARVTKV
ncbi:molybdopterin oxidoreductase family protein [Solidesulfovibrio sp. C21]|uniref:molybdopterin oxidoreductase family protein n=1 Tax=Solidesulfovibrio sp. C21 TaxID=3398613 RepID=UPI0039FBAEE3